MEAIENTILIMRQATLSVQNGRSMECRDGMERQRNIANQEDKASERQSGKVDVPAGEDDA